MKRKCCCWLARNPRLQGSEELNVVLPGLQNGSPAVTLLVHAEIQVISEEVLVSLNCLEKRGYLWGRGESGLLPVLMGRPRSWGMSCAGSILAAVRTGWVPWNEAWEQESVHVQEVLCLGQHFSDAAFQLAILFFFFFFCLFDSMCTFQGLMNYKTEWPMVLLTWFT